MANYRGKQFNSVFASIVISEAKRRGWTLNKMALKMQVDRRTLLAHMEHPREDSIVYEKAATLFGVTVESLRHKVFVDGRSGLVMRRSS